MINREILLQAQQRLAKLLEEKEKLEDLEFRYHTLCDLEDYSIVQSQKDYVEFLENKLKNTLSIV